ncbi:E1 ubiquitin-activating protein aos1 [Marasmius tenuissimus]|nr:E1 ubiquitin-activating protein aos1 [Marasmius tenuissimus]
MSSSTTPNTEFTEEEQGRYDRQIRLWGIEAQQRMRNATILVVNMKGTATETIKNIVLAGIGTLIIVDGNNVTEEDLGAGFFFRDEDVGSKRVDVAKSRIESLNPLVAVKTVPSFDAIDPQAFETTVRDVDLVCVTDWDRDGVIRMNNVCRRAGKPFYAGGTYGLLGYIFCDLLDHPSVSPKGKTTTSYVPLETALRHRWSSLTRRQTKELNPAAVFLVLAIWHYQSVHAGSLPSSAHDAPELQNIADALLKEADVNKQVLEKVSEDLFESATPSTPHEFSPVCAVVGGMLGQDILKCLGGRDIPIANFFVFDGIGAGGAGTGGGGGGASVVRMGM